jgi:Tol biopolymer transport system component
MTFIATPVGSSTSPEVMLATGSGGDPKPLGPATTAVLSPNGDYVAAVRSGSGSAAHGSSLVLYSVASRRPARVLRSSSAQLTILAWSPDSAWIAVIDGDSLVAVPLLHGKARTIATGTINGASFAPTPPDRLVFARAASLLVGSKVNLYTVSLSGGAPRALTHDGLSQYPLWGPNGIVYSREESQSSTTYQLWSIKSDGGHPRQLTDLTLSASFYGLEPIAFSANGQHLLANLVGANTTEAWTIDLSAKQVLARDVGMPDATTIGNAISSDGSTLLLTEGSAELAGNDFEGQSVAIVPWSGGLPTVVAAHAAFASWSR